VVENIIGGTAQNPLAVLEEDLALASAMYASRLDISHVNVLNRNQLEVRQPRNMLESSLEHQDVYLP